MMCIVHGITHFIKTDSQDFFCFVVVLVVVVVVVVVKSSELLKTFFSFLVDGGATTGSSFNFYRLSILAILKVNLGRDCCCVICHRNYIFKYVDTVVFTIGYRKTSFYDIYLYEFA